MRIAFAALSTLGLLVGIFGWFQLEAFWVFFAGSAFSTAGWRELGVGIVLFLLARTWMAALPGRGTKVTAQVAGD